MNIVARFNYVRRHLSFVRKNSWLMCGSPKYNYIDVAFLGKNLDYKPQSILLRASSQNPTPYFPFKAVFLWD